MRLPDFIPASIFLAGSVIATILVIIAVIVVEATVGLHEALGRTGFVDMLVAALVIGGVSSWWLTQYLKRQESDGQSRLKTHIGYTKLGYIASLALLFLTIKAWPATDLKGAYTVTFLVTLAVMIAVNGFLVFRNQKR